MLFPYNILAFTEIGLPPTYVYVRRMGIVIMPECCVNASLFLIAELRPANFSDVFWCQKSCRFRRPNEHARLVFVSFKRDSSARLCSDVLTNVARTFFTSCMQVHCSFLFSGIIRFLMQELLALAGLSRCRVWKVTVEEFYSWQRLHSFSFRNRFLDMNRFFSFLGKSKVVQG